MSEYVFGPRAQFCLGVGLVFLITVYFGVSGFGVHHHTSTTPEPPRVMWTAYCPMVVAARVVLVRLCGRLTLTREVGDVRIDVERLLRSMEHYCAVTTGPGSGRETRTVRSAVRRPRCVIAPW